MFKIYRPILTPDGAGMVEVTDLCPAHLPRYVSIKDYLDAEVKISALERQNAELVEKVKELGDNANELRALSLKWVQKCAKSDATNLKLFTDNTLLRKRLEPIEELWGRCIGPYHDPMYYYFGCTLDEDDIRRLMYEALERCMEMKESE